MALGIEYKGQRAIKKINEIDFFDIKRFTAKRGADLLGGQGITVRSQDEGIQNYLNEVTKTNRFDGLMLQIMEEVNYWGRVILTINKTKTDDFMFSFATPELLQQVENIEITPFHAKLMLRKVVGLKVFFVNETWTTVDVTRTFTVKDGDGPISAFEGEIADLPLELQLPEHEQHNLGFVPFQEITNKEARNIMFNGFGSSSRLADDYPVRNLALNINYGLRQQYKEKWKGASRIFGALDSSYAQKLIQDGTIANVMADDYVIEVGMTPGQSKPVEVSPATYDSSKWFTGWQAEIDLYMIGCGYSPLFGNNQQQTEAETLLSKDADQRTTKQKRRRYTEFLRDLFAKLIVYKGMADSIKDAYDQITVEIKENVVYNQLQLVDFLNNAVNYGLMTRTEAIMLQRDIDNKEDAEQVLKEIEKDQDAQDERTAKMMSMAQPQPGEPGAENPQPGEGTGALAPGKDPDKKSDKIVKGKGE